jgi:hypothetical protein
MFEAGAAIAVDAGGNVHVAGTTVTPDFQALVLKLVCAGDCDGRGSVSIDELIVGVNAALGLAPASACPAFDADRNAALTIDELIRGVTRALEGCP